MPEFLAVSLEDCVGQIEQQLLSANLNFGHGTDNAFDEAAWLVMSAASIDVGAEPLDWQQILSNQQQLAVKRLVEKRIVTRKPLAYLLKRAWFAGYEFYIDERAIVPRSYLGEWIPGRFEPWLTGTPVESALDLCTGSGCIAIALALEFPEAKVDAVDVSPVALDVAAINIAEYGVSQRVRLLQGDLFSALAETAHYELIVCNPPYLANQAMESLPLEYRFEPPSALAGGIDGLDFVYRVLTNARQYLKKNGRLFVEVGNAIEVVEKVWPTVPFTWLMSLSGESVVLTLTAGELESYGEHLNQPKRQKT